MSLQTTAINRVLDVLHRKPSRSMVTDCTADETISGSLQVKVGGEDCGRVDAYRQHT